MDFQTAYGPLIYISSLFGVSAITLTRLNGSNNFVVSKTSVMYCLFTLIAYLIFTCLAYGNMPPNYTEINLFSITGQVIGIGDFVLFSISHYTALVHRKRILKIWTRLHFSSRKLFGKRNLIHRRSFIFIIIQSIFHFVLVYTAKLSNEWDTFFLFLFYLLFAMVDYLNYIAELSFTSVLFILSGLLEKLDLKFRKLVCIAEKNSFFKSDEIMILPAKNTPGYSSVGLTKAVNLFTPKTDTNLRRSNIHPKEVGNEDILWSPTYFVKELNRLAEFQSSLYELSQDIEQVYGVQILFSVAQAFISTTFTMFVFFLIMLNLKAAAQFTAPVQMLVLWGISIAIRLLVLVYSCNSASKKADELGTQLSSLLVDMKHPQIREEIQMFSLQLLHNKVRFTACGFFPLDATLLYGVVGGVTTYLVILIQFQLASEHK